METIYIHSFGVLLVEVQVSEAERGGDRRAECTELPL